MTAKKVKKRATKGTKRRRRYLTERKAAMQMNTIYNMFEKGKTVKQIRKKLGMTSGKFSLYVSVLREGTKRTKPSFIPPKGVYNWSRAKARRVENLIEYATKIIKGEKAAKAKQRKPGVVPWALPKTVHRKITTALMKDPFRSSNAISKVEGASPNTVVRQRRILESKGLIPVVSRSKIMKNAERKPERTIDYLDKKRRKTILEEKKKAIESTAKRLYRENRVAFDGTDALPEQIPEEIAERMEWRLRTFNPKNWKGSEKVKVNKFFYSALSSIKFDIRRTAWKQYSRQKLESLETGMEEKQDRKRTLQAKPESKEITVKQLEMISDGLKLNLLEKAVLFGHAAGLTGSKIAEVTGYSEARINQKKFEYQKRIQKIISKK